MKKVPSPNLSTGDIAIFKYSGQLYPEQVVKLKRNGYAIKSMERNDRN